uniref:Uncharacterized protein n=1 Tax=Arundo donax TaxID=35708 RepID=A0A0A9BW44_ARUDO
MSGRPLGQGREGELVPLLNGANGSRLKRRIVTRTRRMRARRS